MTLLLSPCIPFKLKMQAVQSVEFILHIELGPLLVCVDLYPEQLELYRKPSLLNLSDW